jgi:magnesium chelatase family protein
LWRWAGAGGGLVAIVSTVAFLGLEARAVEAQVQLLPGLPNFIVVGLADKAVTEARERVRSALGAIGLALPPKRITVNLSPADLPKEGSHFDLPIALALLGAMGVIDAETLSEYVAVGELGLDGRIAPAPGVLLAALHASELDRGLICPAAQGSEAAWAGRIEVLAAPDLLALINHLKGTGQLTPPVGGPDLRQVKGQETAKRALEIAAAGGYNLLMVGPPGAGKSLMAACLPAILPDLTPSEALEVSGPLLDRIDLHVKVRAVSAADLVRPPPAEGSAGVAARVAAARAVQTGRYAPHGLRTNAEADGELLDLVASPDEPGRKLLAQAAEQMRLSARGYHRVLRVARTIADLAGSEGTGRVHVAEALSYRRRAPVN